MNNCILDLVVIFRTCILRIASIVLEVLVHSLSVWVVMLHLLHDLIFHVQVTGRHLILYIRQVDVSQFLNRLRIYWRIFRRTRFIIHRHNHFLRLRLNYFVCYLRTRGHYRITPKVLFLAWNKATLRLNFADRSYFSLKTHWGFGTNTWSIDAWGIFYIRLLVFS